MCLTVLILLLYIRDLHGLLHIHVLNLASYPIYMIRTLYICVNIELDAANHVYTDIMSCILKLLLIIHVTSVAAGINCHYFSNYICGTSNCICIPRDFTRICEREICIGPRIENRLFAGHLENP